MKAPVAIQRGSQALIFLPTCGVKQMAKMPTGASAMPAEVAVYPIHCCNHRGSNTTLPKNSPYATDKASAPNAKLRPMNKRRSTTGCSSVSSQTTKMAKPIKATKPNTTISVEANQSSSLPLSSINCKAPTHSTSRVRPTLSMGSLRVGVSRLRYMPQVSAAEARPTGTLM